MIFSKVVESILEATFFGCKGRSQHTILLLRSIYLLSILTTDTNYWSRRPEV